MAKLLADLKHKIRYDEISILLNQSVLNKIVSDDKESYEVLVSVKIFKIEYE